MTIPQDRAVATYGAVGSGFLTRSWPAGHAAGWGCFVGMETCNEAVQAPGVPHALHLAGFTEAPGSPVSIGTAGDAASTRITVYYRIADQVTMDANGGSMPDFRIYSPGNHISFLPIFVSDLNLAALFVTLAGPGSTQDPASTAVSCPGGDTTGFSDVLFMHWITHAIDTTAEIFNPTWTNAALSNIRLRATGNTGAQNGGGIAIVLGEKAAGGVVGATTGTLTTASKQARLTLAIRGAGGAVTLPASDHQCSAECAAVPGAETNPDRRHLHGVLGTPPVSQTDIARNQGRAWRFVTVDSTGALYWNVGESKRQLRLFLYFPSLPSGDCELVRFRVDPAGNSPELRYRAATQDIVCAVGDQFSTAVPVVTGRFYRVAVAGDVSGTTRTMKLTVDGVDKGQASKSGLTAATITRCEWGASCSTPVTADTVIDDIKTGPDVALYPLGDERMAWVQLVSDGVHSYNAAGDFKKDNLTDLGLAATDAFQQLVGLLDPITSWLSAPAAATAEYLEFLFGGMPSASAISSAELITVHRGPDATASQQKLQLLDSTETLTLFDGFDFSGTVPKYHTRHLTARPGVLGALTQAAINGWKLRWFRGSGVPGFAGAGLEVSYSPVVAPTDPNNQVNPQHTYAGPGSYTVTLTVEDDDGATDSVSHTVTIV